jgi:hypothetical protein
MRLTKSHVVSGVLALALLGATATAWYYAAQARTPAQIAEESEPPEDSVITVRVDQGQLLDVHTLKGELERAGDVDVQAPGSVDGAEVVLASKLPLAVGDDVNAGTVLIEVSGRPMIAMPGSIPAYRDLVEGESEGPDVKQLQNALSWIYGTPATGTFDSRTAQDLRKLYEARGYKPLYKTEEVIDNPPPSNGGGDDDEDDAGTFQEPTTREIKKLMLPASEIVFLESLPMQVGKINAKLSAPLGDGKVMTLVSGDWSLAVQLKDEEASEFQKLGESIELEFGSGPLSGTVPATPELEQREVEDDSGGRWGYDEGGTTQKYFAVFTFDEGDVDADALVPGAEQQITLVRARSAEDALIVPLSALWTDADGKTLLTVLDGEGADMTERHVQVEVKLRHEGRGVVEVVDGELKPRDKVVVAWRDRGGR